MLLGAYTIINTLGVLVGLPTNIQRNNNYNINYNFSSYIQNSYVSNNLLDMSSLNELALIVDFSENTSLASTSKIDIHTEKRFKVQMGPTTSSLSGFTFNYSTKVNNYSIFTYNAIQTGRKNSTASFDWTTDYTELPVKQVYIGRLTSSLSSLGGDSITGSISSGLGLMEEITKQFGSGFGTLIWDSSKNSLTTFGNFSLIFLGVSITFAIVKLCMSLIRSKTGS